MIIFKLPDLGEGLPDAIIREWHVKVGDEVTTDQPIVVMETAKALVDVPAPFAGKIIKLFGNVDDTIETGQPLVGFEGEGDTEVENKDAGTVVGAIETSDTVIEDHAQGVGQQQTAQTNKLRATPAVRALARRLGVDLQTIKTSSDRITAEDIENAAKNKTTTTTAATINLTDMQTLTPVRKAMVLSMQKSRDEVVPVTVCDDANIHNWPSGTDILLRIIRAIAKACEIVPIANATFDGATMSYQLNKEINLAIAVDTEHGLYAPVIKNVNKRDDQNIREQVNQFKAQAQTRSIPQEDLRGGNIMLSNFGSIAGRYANPIVVPPMVITIGVGKIRDDVIAEEGQPVVRRIMPLAVSSDHRLVTGGESIRILRALMDALNSYK